MLVSVCLDPGRPWADTLELARNVDAAGFPRVYLPDHFMPYHPSTPVPGPVSGVLEHSDPDPLVVAESSSR